MSALERIAAELREEAVIAPFVRARGDDFAVGGALGALAAAGSRAASAPEEYALVVESVREGYLLHYGEPRLIVEADQDLRLLAGDFLYALGLDRLAQLGDLAAVRELADLISLCAQAHAAGAPRAAEALWLSTALAIGCGAGDQHRRAKEKLRRGAPDAVERLRDAASAQAERAALRTELGEAGDSIGFAFRPTPSSG